MHSTTIKSHDSSIGRALDSSIKVPPQMQQTFSKFRYFYPIFNVVVVLQMPHKFSWKILLRYQTRVNSA